MDNPRYSRKAKPFLLLIPLVGLATAVFVFLSNEAPPSDTHPLDPLILDSNLGINYAYNQFELRGGKNEYGPNDCSVFISDYLKGSGTPPPHRFNTADLAVPKNLAPLGYSVVESNPEPGDILAFRFKNMFGRTQGHCGVVTEFNGEPWVVNNLPSKGVVMQPLKSFELMAQRASPTQFFCYRRDPKV